MAHPSPSSAVHPDEPSDPLDPLGGWRPLGPETPREQWDRWRARALRSPLRAAGAVLAVAVLAAAAWWLLRPPAPPVESTLPLASAPGSPGSPGAAAGSAGPAGPAGPGGSAAGAGGGAADGAVASSSTTAPDLVVQASGAVARPGVYRLAAGARVDDLVRAAGGLAPAADPDRVNLAAPVADGERVWLPRRGEAEAPPVVAGAAGGSAGSPSGAAGGSDGTGGSTTPVAPVNLNQAAAEQLDTLPGVGPATAAAILAYRDEQGPFAAVDDLLEVRGIGDAKLEQLRPLVTV